MYFVQTETELRHREITVPTSFIHNKLWAIPDTLCLQVPTICRGKRQITNFQYSYFDSRDKNKPYSQYFRCRNRCIQNYRECVNHLTSDT